MKGPLIKTIVEVLTGGISQDEAKEWHKKFAPLILLIESNILKDCDVWNIWRRFTQFVLTESGCALLIYTSVLAEKDSIKLLSGLFEEKTFIHSAWVEEMTGSKALPKVAAKIYCSTTAWYYAAPSLSLYVKGFLYEYLEVILDLTKASVMTSYELDATKSIAAALIERNRYAESRASIAYEAMNSALLQQLFDLSKLVCRKRQITLL